MALPLLSFGAGAADGFAYLVLGGIFTANMTGNAVLATMYGRPDYPSILIGALTAIAAFAIALVVGFRTARAGHSGAARKALIVSAICHAAVVLMWWCSTRSGPVVLCLIAASAAAMAFQTVAAKRDGVDHGATTTYATGTLTDLLKDLVDGQVNWCSIRWLSLFALPAGAALSVAVARTWPDVTPLIPLIATVACIRLISPEAL
ncbi:DUF1275 family protein [Sphingomonas faeni]|uniref:DUF1275 family protein n=1 Tax=Sphingomonas faeni TaxID=185950 RepID=UPI0027D88665|nr:DUF1275 family protein [Sphingomonas faeni]